MPCSKNSPALLGSRLTATAGGGGCRARAGTEAANGVLGGRGGLAGSPRACQAFSGLIPTAKSDYHFYHFSRHFPLICAKKHGGLLPLA